MARLFLIVLTFQFLTPGAYAGDLNLLSGFEDPLEIITVEPPVALQSAGVNATAHVSGLLSAPFSVRLVGLSAEEIFPPFTFDPAHPGLLAFDIPPALATGAWDLEVTRSNQSETAGLGAAFQIVDSLTVVFDLQPNVFSSAAGGEFRLDSDEAFAVLPQVLLRLDTALPTEPAVRLQGVEFKSEDRIFAPVPPGLSAGAYDVIAINPDGSAGLVNQGLIISAEAAPSISQVYPLVVPVNAASQFFVEGSGFNPAVTAALTCEDDLTQPLTVTVNESTSLTLDYSPGGLNEGLCIIDLLNPDGQDAAFASVRLAPASGGIGEPAAISDLQVARRAPSLALHRVDGESFSLYAMGGDDGASANALDSVEIGVVGEFGEIDGWVMSRNTLPAGRTFAWASQFGEFLYLVGGNDGTSAVDTVLRAQILDSAAAPLAVRHTFLLAEGAPGYSGGLQAFRVAAVFPSTDPVNPNGESLAGPSRNVIVPNMADVALRLEWDPVPGAEAYNVYTNPAGVPYDGDSEVLELVATTNATSWVQNGQPTDPAVIPLLPGETGAWHQVASWSMGTPRSHLAGAIAPLKGAPESIVLYAFGGVDEMGTTLSSYEYSVISNAGTATPGYGTFANGTDNLGAELRNLVAWSFTVDGTDDSWVFAGTGFDDMNAAQNDIERGTVSMSGDLGTLVAGGTSPAQSRAGASGLVGAASLALGGGANGLASTGIQESFLSDSGSGPEMGIWNSTGFGLLQERIYAGTTHGAVFIFVAGGADSLENALSSVERLTR
ncbi:MAG TPA: hypothetical protein VJ984_15785 [Xanthomonadales bacterium]|nr:hypothetical protein [Xanthomonadales bacterium]